MQVNGIDNIQNSLRSSSRSMDITNEKNTSIPQSTESKPYNNIDYAKPGGNDKLKHAHSTNEISSSSSSSSLKILFLSSDTGGGHRASAESLARQFELLYPGSTYKLVDIISEHAVAPYNALVESYKHLSSHPVQWKTLYTVSNTTALHFFTDVHLKVTSETDIRNCIKSYEPDVVISVHPLMTQLPAGSCQRISNETNKHLPFFIVITDLASAHRFWFANEGVEAVFVACHEMKHLAMEQGISSHKLKVCGLPIRNEFSIHAKYLKDRFTKDGITYQHKMRKMLGILHSSSDKVILAVGGGEGVGQIKSIVKRIFYEFIKQSTAQNITIVVICGRNERLKSYLLQKNWNNQLAYDKLFPKSIAQNVVYSVQNFIYGSEIEKEETSKRHQYQIRVVPLGFVNNIAEYMVSADLLISKAGPGTIAEAASLSLPILLTSFLPGQEEGNVDFVKNHGFGDFCSDENPQRIAEIVVNWVSDEHNTILKRMSQQAKLVGNPNSAKDIVNSIGESALRWKELNYSGVL